MKPAKILHFVAGLLFAALQWSVVVADDTDIYMSVGSRLPPGSEPIVIFSLDYRPNLGSTACNGNECDGLIAEGYMSPTGPYTFFDVLRGALRKVMDPVEGVRVGLMLNHQHQNNCAGPNQSGCSNGGYIAMGVLPFQRDDANGAKKRFHDILAALPTPQGNVSHSYQGKELFFELFRYLTGQDIYNGHNGWRDYGTDNSQNLDVDGAAYAWDASIETTNKKTYVSPLVTANECTSIFTVNPLFFVANQENDSDAAIQASIADQGFGIEAKEFTNAIQYLNDVDLGDGTFGTVPAIEGTQNIKSYFLISPSQINRTTIGYARSGGTGFPLPLSNDPEELVATLQEIFKQVLSISTTFVAASVPVNAFNRAELLGNVYLALFQVDGDLRASWRGNVKKLRLEEIEGVSLLVDALDEPAVAGDGRIRFDALTHWTLPSALPPADAAAGEVDGRDGRFVSRGGAGQQLSDVVNGSPGLVNGVGARKLFFDWNGGLAPLNADSVTATALQGDLGAASLIEATELIAFARGTDIDDVNGNGNVLDARPWLFGDALHSQPLVLNYGAHGGYSESNPAVYLAVGTNDGFMRFIRDTTTSGGDSGEEVWAFMPRETMGIQKTLRENGSSTPHPYGVDGAASAWINDINHNGTIEFGENVYIYFGLRRGGRAYYALDVTDPENPALLWTIERGGDFAELGYTFSRPRVGFVDIGNGRQPVIIFGGGYDLNKDDRTAPGTDDSEGTAIYVVDAQTGALIWKARGGTAAASATVFEHADLLDSIPSDVTIADTNGDGLTDRILVGDTGGNVWRVDMAGPDTIGWKLTRLAALGRHAESGKQNDRRFFHRPDIVQTRDENGLFDAVLIGSGDRPDPLDVGGVVTNYLYMLKDRNVAAGTGAEVNLTPAELGDVTDNCLQEGSNCSVTLTYGWKLQLEETGEKSLSTPLTIAGTVFFTTYIPPGLVSGGSCSPAEGSGRLYAVSLKNASAVMNYDTSVDGDPLGGGTTKSDRYTVLNSPGIPAEVVFLPPNMVLRPDLQPEELGISTRWRTFWFIEEDSDL